MENFEALYKTYLELLGLATVQRLHLPSRNHMRPFIAWTSLAFESAQNQSCKDEVSKAWQSFKKKDKEGQASNLFIAELKAFQDAAIPIVNAMDEQENSPIDRINRPAKLKDILKAGRTLLESLLDAFGDDISKISRSILRSVKEALDVAVG